jgi:ABC-2 type transport system ATP-binding protein
MNAIEIRNLSKSFRGMYAVDHLHMTVPQGAIYGFIGENGSGKSTTEKLICGHLVPDEGEIRLFGRDYTDPGVRVRVGALIENAGCFPNSSVYRNLMMQCINLGIENPDAEIRRVLEIVRMEEHADLKFKKCSLGMKQRIGIAMALLGDPALLILDEPASGMDPRARADMKTILRTLREMGKTVLISSHILPELSEMCDSLTILDHGKLVFSGSVEALSEKMNGSAPLEIRLREGSGEEELENAVKILKENPAVKEILQEGSTLLKIRLEEPAPAEEQTAVILRELVSRGVPVCDFHRAPMNLEKVFMEVTEDA